MRGNKCSYKVKANNVIAYVKRNNYQDTNTHSIKVLDKETQKDTGPNEEGRGGKLTATATIRHRRGKKVVPTAEDMQPHKMNKILNRCQQAELYWAPSHDDDNQAVVDNMSMDDGNFQITKLKGQGNPRTTFHDDHVDRRKTMWPGPHHGHGDHYSGPRKSEVHRDTVYSEAPSVSPSPSHEGSDLSVKESGDNYRPTSANEALLSSDKSPWASATSRSVEGTYYNGNHEQSHRSSQPGYEDHHHRPSLPAHHDHHHRMSKTPQDSLPCIALCCCCRLAQLQQDGRQCCLGLRLGGDHHHGHPKHHDEHHRASHGTQSEPVHHAHHASYSHHTDHGTRENSVRVTEDGPYDEEEYAYSEPRDHHKMSTRPASVVPEYERHAHSPEYDHGPHHGDGHSHHPRKSIAPHPDRHHEYPDHPYDHGPHHGGDHSPHGGEHHNIEPHHRSHTPHPDRHHEYPDRHHEYPDHRYDHGPHHGGDHSPHVEHYDREYHHKTHPPHPDRHHEYPDRHHDYPDRHHDYPDRHHDYPHPRYDHGPHHGGDHSPHVEHYDREYHHKTHPPHPDRHHDYPDRHHDYPDRHHDYPDRHHDYPDRRHDYPDRHHDYPDRHHDYPVHPYDHGPHHGGDHSPRWEHHNRERHRRGNASHWENGHYVHHEYPDHYDRDYWRSHEEFLSQGYTYDKGTDCPPQCKAPPDDSCKSGGCCLPFLVTSCTVHGEVSGDQAKKTTSDNYNNTTNSCSDQPQFPGTEEVLAVWNPKNTQDECNHCFDLCEVQNDWQQEPLTSRPSDEVASQERDHTRILIRPFQEPQVCASSGGPEPSPVKNGFRVKAYMNNMAPSPNPNSRPLNQAPKATQSSYHCFAGQTRLVSPRAARAQVVSPCCPRDPAAPGCKDAPETKWNEMTIKVSTRQKPPDSQPKNSTLIKVNTKRYPS